MFLLNNFLLGSMKLKIYLHLIEFEKLGYKVWDQLHCRRDYFEGLLGPCFAALALYEIFESLALMKYIMRLILLFHKAYKGIVMIAT